MRIMFSLDLASNTHPDGVTGEHIYQYDVSMWFHVIKTSIKSQQQNSVSNHLATTKK